MTSYMDSSAVLSECGTYRYVLRRSWEPTSHGARVLWVMLNPSTADAEQDDPTIRRCVSFSKAWGGFGHMSVVNLWALRATDPAELLAHPDDPSGPDNWRHIEDELSRSQMAVAAWGANVDKVPGGVWINHTFEAKANQAGVPLLCLGHTKAGHPRHPLYVKADAALVDFSEAA